MPTTPTFKKVLFRPTQRLRDAKALTFFEEAIRLDSNYAETYLALSRSRSSGFFFRGLKAKEEYELARQATLKAVH